LFHPVEDELEEVFSTRFKMEKMAHPVDHPMVGAMIDRGAQDCVMGNDRIIASTDNKRWQTMRNAGSVGRGTYASISTRELYGTISDR
jgi:hypothetical protein